MPSSSHHNNASLIVLLLLILLSFVVNLGSAPLFDEDEGAYSEVTREMLVNQDFTTSYLNGKPFFHKPPMFYWMQAASVSLFGQKEFGFRFPSALAAILWTLTVYFFTRRYLGPAVAWYTAFFMVCSLQITLIGKAAIPDALLNLFITLTMFNLYGYYLAASSPPADNNRKSASLRQRRHLHAAYMFTALGVLTKGPIAIVIPLAAGTCFFGLQRQWRAWLAALTSPVGILLFCLIALPWYIGAYLTHGQAFIDEIFLKHNISRFRNAFEGHSGPVFYYIPVVLVGLLPFTAFFLKAATRIRQLTDNKLHIFLLIWFLFVFVFFSLAQTKLHHYVVYGYVPLFIFMATMAEEVRKPVSQAAGLFFLLLFFFFVPEIISLVKPYLHDRFALDVLRDSASAFPFSYKLSIGTGLLLVMLLHFLKRISQRIRLVILGTIFLLLANNVIIPAAAGIMQQPVKDAALQARVHGYEVITWRLNFPSFNVYLGKITEERQPNPGEIVLTKSIHLDAISQYEVLFAKNGIVLARVIRFD